MKQANTEKLLVAIQEVMGLLCNLPSGGIGPDGATIEELDIVAEKGAYLDNDAVFDMGQRMYRILEKAIANKE